MKLNENHIRRIMSQRGFGRLDSGSDTEIENISKSGKRVCEGLTFFKISR